jgi:hypothetical protein
VAAKYIRDGLPCASNGSNAAEQCSEPMTILLMKHYMRYLTVMEQTLIYLKVYSIHKLISKA